MINDNKKEYFIDLHCLAHYSTYNDQRVVLYFRRVDGIADDTILHMMRKAVRNVGATITRIEKQYDNNDLLVQVEFFTDIPSSIWDESVSLYNTWITEVGLA